LLFGSHEGHIKKGQKRSLFLEVGKTISDERTLLRGEGKHSLALQGKAGLFS